LDRRQLLVITVVALPAMLVGVLVLMFADSGGSKATDLPGTEPVGWVSPPTFSATLLPTSDPVPTSAPAPTTTATTPPPAGTGPFMHGIYGSHPQAAEQAEIWKSSRPADAALMARMGRTPTATWLGDWTPDVRQTASDLVGAAAPSGRRPVFVTYYLPARDCGGYSSGGGAANEADYRAWIRDLAGGIGNRRAAVILEPDALAQYCGDIDAMNRMLRDAIEVLGAGADTAVYLDAGHAQWLNVTTAVQRLRAAGVAEARGFSLNVSNFVRTAETEKYGEQIVTALGGNTHYVVDTSRNGNGPAEDWCNPPGRALGTEPTADTASAHADAYLWIKVPGESDGACNGASAAGTWMPEYALGLARGTPGW
jgi:endoglucanase